jgi:hypothetical protein
MLIPRYLPGNGRWTLSRTCAEASRFWHALLRRLSVLSCPSALVLATLACAGCDTQTKSNAFPSLTPAADAQVEAGVRAFMRSVAHDVTEQGPLAWRNYFNASPSFFMAVNGHLAFPNGAAASEGTQAFAKTIKHIELKWDDDLRVDPLTPEFAVVATPWREIMVDSAGHRVDEAGFFSALAEYRDGHWQFRDAHWSSPVSP